MEATMRKFFLITLVLLSATAAHAGLDVTAANADGKATEAAPEASQPSSARRPDALAARRQGMMQQKMMMRKQMMMRRQMAMQQEMQRHPIRTRFHFALLRFKQKLHYAFHELKKVRPRIAPGPDLTSGWGTSARAASISCRRFA
jgi:hypothetical protein